MKDMNEENKMENENVQPEMENQQENEEQTAKQTEEQNDANEAEVEKELTPEEQLQQKLDEQTLLLAAMQDKYLRSVADFDNFRKRTIQEKAELIKNGGAKVITEILPVLDDFERALKTMENAEDVKSVKEGVDLIFQKFIKTLQQQGVKAIETEGQDFNTDFHEAIALVPAPNDELKGKVLDCVQTGYILNDKVIRHAKVAVAQ